MILGHLLLSVLALCSSSVLAVDYDGTRIANRTIERTVQLRTHSLFAPYIDQDLQNRCNSNKYIRLTRNVQSQMVHISTWMLWSRLPLTSTNFIIEVEFKISGSTSHLFGDRAQPGPVFGSKDHFTGLGIFLDTYKNDLDSDLHFPRVVAMQGDGQTSYDVGKDGMQTMIGDCTEEFRHSNVATKLKVIYVKDTVLDVKIQSRGCATFPLPMNPYIGLTAMTGDVSDAHDIVSVSVFSAVLSAAEAPRDKLQVIHSGAGWFSSFVRFLILAQYFSGNHYGEAEVV
ncbi:concanavalin A-like lectin/glucanase domain-containing protein [Russula brevipes]|nr:concanavalin A-like lectin/glucanase domain-containing protein [Russula brevipes]